MRIEPLARLRVTVGTGFDVRANRLVVHEIPTLPARSLVGWSLRPTVFFFADQIPFPGSVFFGQPFPRLVPELRWTKVVDN